MEREYTRLVIGRLDGDGPNYELRGLPEGADFRDESEYERIEASWLKMNGVGLACDALEISEHGQTVTVQQETDGGSAHIYT